MRDYVFGYGSLVKGEFLPSRDRRAEGFVADLRGVRRAWGVAMDNRVDLPGYKRYLDPAGGRPAVSVCFLDIVDSPQGRVNGVCLPVTAAELAGLDRRERNYDRIDVSERFGGLDGARVWTYRGSVDGRARFRSALSAGTAVVHAGYLRAVEAGFRALGEPEWTACAPSLDAGGLPVLELVRHDLP
jgi:Gamma-glutamyl cyclotransferase, AIG2-like